MEKQQDGFNPKIRVSIEQLKTDDFEIAFRFGVKRRFLQEYGETVRELASPGNSKVKMAVYIAPPYVWVLPSFDGEDGVFFKDLGGAEADYAGVRYYKPEGYLSDWCNISAHVDGCNAYAKFLNLGIAARMKTDG